LEHHFSHYKDLKKPGSTKVEGWGNEEEAWKIIEECNKRYLQEFSK
jgi:inorganic pyrophosphatase